jgi:hypothetical protein
VRDRRTNELERLLTLRRAKRRVRDSRGIVGDCGEDALTIPAVPALRHGALARERRVERIDEVKWRGPLVRGLVLDGIGPLWMGQLVFSISTDWEAHAGGGKASEDR